MTTWNGTILGPPHSVHENRIYSLSINCPGSYPEKPPDVSFLTRVNLPAVGSFGKVDFSKIQPLSNWSRAITINDILVAIRRSMAEPANRKMAQPPEGSTYI
ncbi:MAG: E2 ubiquitin-conjugating protein mms2 [Cyphobasidiales sp. Tagirdzhanova-0007]|nr:MAG: E2 ubiquitin-conjugating protein mms2 [Cyphobasidiales sp. Tagirdzhanova-0007]